MDRRRFLGTVAAGVAGATIAPLPCLAAPAVESRPAPTAPLAMWALTGTLQSADVRRQLDAFHAAGWGVVLYPRWGLELEYLGAAWFERIRFIVEQAAARRMEVWLYDEFTWPSGQAKGLVAANRPDLEAQLLQVQRDGTSKVVTVPGTASLLQPEATQQFLAVTHERYAKAIGEFFGTTVRAIFTDEPSLPHQHRPRPKDDRSWRLSWSGALQTVLGPDFRDRLAAERSAVERSPLWRDYWAAYTRVFHDAWVQPIAGWCQAHRLAFTGHLLGEHSFGTQVAYNGSLRRQLAAFGIPGIDEISTRTDPGQCETLTLAAIAEFPHRERMAEVYALGPPSMKLDTMRRMVNLCAAVGVDRYVLAICPHDFRGGMSKREYFGIYGPQQPWFQDGAKVYAEHVAEAAGRARAAKPLGLPWPADEELWQAAGPEPTKSPALKALTEKFVALAREAICARLEPGTVTPAALVTRRNVEADWAFGVKGLNSLRLDQATVTVIDVPRTVELSVQAQLVHALHINGTEVQLDTAPLDQQFDLSYRRIVIPQSLRPGVNRIEMETNEPKPLKFLPALVLWGDFALDAQGRMVKPPSGIKLGDWRPQGYPALCGTGRYQAVLNFDAVPSRLGLDTGGYPARVILNGKDLGWRAWPPFEFELRGAARRGRNEIAIEITSTLGHLVVPAESPPVGLLSVWIEP